MARKRVMKMKIFPLIKQIALVVCIISVSTGCSGDIPTETILVNPTTTQVELTMTPTETLAEAEGIISALDIPAGAPPNIDGIHSPGEWDEALVVAYADGSQLLMLKDEDYLYLGIKGIDAEIFSNNVFINQGDQIAILHSSAALGTAIYQKVDNSWNQTQDFSWRCRKTDQSVAARMERAEFLEAEGWLASNGLMGTPNEMEYMISIPDQVFRMAVTIIRSSPPYEKIPWPVNLEDDCIMDTPGGLPEIMDFTISEWEVINLD